MSLFDWREVDRLRLRISEQNKEIEKLKAERDKAVSECSEAHRKCGTSNHDFNELRDTLSKCIDDFEEACHYFQGDYLQKIIERYREILEKHSKKTES